MTCCGFNGISRGRKHNLKKKILHLILIVACVSSQDTSGDNDIEEKRYKVTTNRGDVFGTKQFSKAGSSGEDKKSYYQFLGKYYNIFRLTAYYP